MLTETSLHKIAPFASTKTLKLYVPLLNEICPKWGINTPKRLAHFLAQILHESAEFRYTSEIASGTAYNNRADLGNTRPEAIALAKKYKLPVGTLFKGHGLIQVTGYDNHLAASKALKIDCVNNPGLLTLPENALASACWFWTTRDLNIYADKDWFKTITRRINGGYNGIVERRAYLARAKQELCKV